MKAKATLRKPEMNRWESEYDQMLRLEFMAGEILDYGFQRITLKLGADCRYTPDFDVVRKDGTLELHEVKGFFRDDAKVKIKAAANKFKFVFILARKEKGAWDISTVDPA